MKNAALMIAAAALVGAGLATDSLAGPKCGGCPAPKTAEQKAACEPGCQKPCCPTQAKAVCGADCAKTCCAGKDGQSHNYATVDTDGLKKLIADDKDVIVVDARSGKYDDGRRIGGAKQVGAAASDEEIMKALPDKDAKIVAYCTNTKCPASAKLSERLVTLGYKNVVKYPDGIDAWVEAGNDVSK